MSFVDIAGATYAYRSGADSEIIVDNIDWRIGEGEFHCLVGRSGCGKTTFLKVAAGLLKPTAGAVFIQGVQVLEPLWRGECAL